eukprot:scaffold1936_cov201-Alexandrium_tamarense.AAC.11
MGSSQSQPTTTTDQHFETTIDATTSVTTTTANKAKIKPPRNESSYAKAQRKCNKKKISYDACYTAALSSKEEDCADLFESYKSCFLRVMTNDMERRGVKVKEGSMIGEYKEEIEDEEAS